ncbi:MAG: tRNA 2-thiouridine(34) synthase MnmA [Chloroflexi bacterium]|nr:tRNA 2-thiouridine(34) synthase MnmA [Chloroflexota bacterium]
MSGGVDSSVAAALLVDAGHEVIGITLNVEQPGHSPDDRREGCCSLASIEDARRVADQIGIPHYSLNFRERFARMVVDDFVAEYERGRTPNPCVRCNQHIKFDGILDRLAGLDADFVATGHYARVEHGVPASRSQLLRALDGAKDQSYVLYPVQQSTLRRVLFPLGNLHKADVRAIARGRGLRTAEKPESQEICFVTGGHYGSFVAEHATAPVRRGPIVTVDGQVVGEHRGLIYYTIGQRRGLGVAGADPRYVVDLDPTRNAVVIGRRELLDSTGCVVDAVNWVSIERPREALRCEVRVRAHAPLTPATIHVGPTDSVAIEFDEPQRAVAPGQAAVVYQGDRVLGGGTIARAMRPWARERAMVTPAS